MATLSQFNNTNVPLLAGQTFTGAWERSLRNLEVTCFINSSSYALLTIEQSVDASNVRIPTSFNYTPTTEVSTFSVSIGLPFFRVKLLNVDIGTQAYLSLNTYLIPTPPQQVQVNGSVVASITGIVDVSGNVVSTPALNPAQLRTLPLVVGHWYQVSSVGDTPGAVWAEMGAIVAGESVPPVGRQFQCLYAGYGTGTCYDITAPVNTSGTANVSVANDVSCNVISPLDASGNVLVNDANVKYGWGDATYPVVPQGLVGVKLMGMNAGYETWLQDGGAIPVTLTDTITVAISQDGSNNVVDVSGNTYDQFSNLYVNVQGWDYGGTIPVGLDTDQNTIKIDQANNGVKVNPTAQAPVRVTGLANTAKSVGGPGLIYGASYQNKSSTVNCWIKLYDKLSEPTAGDTPFLIQYLEAVQLYTLSHANDNFFNAPIANTLWVRASLLPDDNDNTDTGVDAEATFFVGS